MFIKLKFAETATQSNFRTQEAFNIKFSKMFSIKHFIILSAMVCVAYCAAVSIPQSKSNILEEFCEYQGTFVKKGESLTIGTGCVGYNCSEDYDMSILG